MDLNPVVIAKLLELAMKHGDEDPLVIEEWTDWDGAAFSLGVTLGFWSDTDVDPLSFRVKNKHVFWTNNKLGNSLYEILNELVKVGVLEKREEPDIQYRSKK
jgi:hypothetical protein